MDILRVLSDTPLPTILVVGGFFFLFIAVGGQFGAKIITDRVRPVSSMALGLVLLVGGIGLFVTQSMPIEENGPEPGLQLENLEMQIAEIEKAIGENEDMQRRIIEEIRQMEQEIPNNPDAEVAIREQEQVLMRLDQENREMHRDLENLRKELEKTQH